MPENPFAGLRAEYADPESGALDWERIIGDVLRHILTVDPGLDLSLLLGVRLGVHFDQVLAQLATERGRPLSATRRESGSAVAKVVPFENGEFLASTFSLIENLFLPDRGEITLNTLHHELAHVHDGAVKRRNLPDVWMKPPRPGGWSHRTLPSAIAAWEEYFACRRAFPTLPGGRSIHAAMFAEEIPRITARSKEAIRRFRRHASVGQLMQDVEPHVHFLFQLAGYVLGTVKGAGQTLQEHDPPAAAVVNASLLGPVWKGVAEHLDHMHATHGAWPSIEVFAPIESAAAAVFAALGLQLTYRDGGPYLLVPFTLDTMPT